MNPFQSSPMLSEMHLAEYYVSFLAKRHILRYVDERKWHRMPAGCTRAGGEV